AGDQGARGEHPVERRDLRREAVLPERRVFARRLHDRADSLAAAVVQHSASAAGEADPAVYGRRVLETVVPGEPDRDRAGDAPVAAMTKKRPYLLRAMHEWILDNDMTPHIVLDTARPALVVLPGRATCGQLL